MNSTRMLTIAVVTFTGISYIALQPVVAAQQGAANTSTQQSGAAGATMAPSAMRSVNGELVSKLNSKSAKTGDSVVVKTTEAVKTAGGTEIPKGSKLVGTVTVVKPHNDDNPDALLAVRFDHAELKGGQNVPIQSVIQSVAPSESDVADNPASNAPVVMGTPMGGGAPGSGGSGAMGGSRPSPNATMGSGAADQSVNGMGAGQGSATGNNNPAVGQVVGKLGNEPIRTTAIPGVLLASNTPDGAVKFSGVFVAPKSDVHLDGGTQVVLEVAAVGGQ